LGSAADRAVLQQLLQVELTLNRIMAFQWPPLLPTQWKP
jgi:hypothetical protein